MQFRSHYAGISNRLTRWNSPNTVATKFGRIIECFGLEGTLKLISVQLPAMDRDTFQQIKFLRAPSKLAWSISRDKKLLWATCARASPPSQPRIPSQYLTQISPPAGLKPLPLVLTLSAHIKSASPCFL